MDIKYLDQQPTLKLEETFHDNLKIEKTQF